MGKLLVAAGVFLVLAGLLAMLLEGRTGWFGNLPGDIRVERGNFRFFLPITTMVLLSVVLSLLLWIIGRFTR